jgi:DNA-binding transcriptional MerR regulator
MAVFQIEELADVTGVTARTIRYYIQQGLLPSPGVGPGVRYTEHHLSRLRAIRQLQAAHLPLAEIRRKLDSLDDASLTEFVNAERPADSAIDYIQRALAGNASLAGTTPGAAPTAPPAPRTASQTRSQWERISVTPDIEIHVRRPLDRERNRRLERLLHIAGRLFEE